MIYVISDIHGEYELFCRLMDKIKFNGGDTLISCGDTVDKGRHSIKLTKLLFSMPNAVCIMGNHEYMFVNYYMNIMKESPSDFDEVLSLLKRYFPDDGDLLDWETVDRLEALPFYYETEDFLCVHASVLLDKDKHFIPLDDIPPEQFVYPRNFKDKNIIPVNEKCVFFGHTPTSYLGGGAFIVGYKREGVKGDNVRDYYKIHLDLGTYQSGVLGCFRTDDCRAFYVER